MVDQSKWSSGELWTMEEEEQLRLAYLDFVARMPRRSEAAVFARVERIRIGNRNWPEQPLTALSKGRHL